LPEGKLCPFCARSISLPPFGILQLSIAPRASPRSKQSDSARTSNPSDGR